MRIKETFEFSKKMFFLELGDCEDFEREFVKEAEI